MAEQAPSGPGSGRKRKAGDQDLQANALPVARRLKMEEHAEVGQQTKSKVEIVIVDDDDDQPEPAPASPDALDLEPYDPAAGWPADPEPDPGQVLASFFDGLIDDWTDYEKWPWLRTTPPWSPEHFSSAGEANSFHALTPSHEDDGEYNFWTDSFTFPSFF